MTKPMTAAELDGWETVLGGIDDAIVDIERLPTGPLRRGKLDALTACQTTLVRRIAREQERRGVSQSSPAPTQSGLAAPSAGFPAENEGQDVCPYNETVQEV